LIVDIIEKDLKRRYTAFCLATLTPSLLLAGVPAPWGKKYSCAPLPSVNKNYRVWSEI